MDKQNWKTVKFGDVVREVRESVNDPLAEGFEHYIGLEHLEPDLLTIKRWGTLAQNETTFKRIFRAGQVLFGRRRAYQRKAAAPDFDGVCSSDIMVFEVVNEEQLLPDLLPFIVQSENFFDYAISTSAGSLSPRTNWTHLSKFEFYQPPVEVQKSIANILWELENYTDRITECISKIDVVAKKHLEMFIEPLLAVGETTCFNNLITRTPESGYSANEVDSETGCYVLSLSALTNRGYRRGHLKAVHQSAQVDAARLSKGDFLISRSNTLEMVGFVGVFDEDRDDVSFPDTMMRIFVDEKKIHKRFLELFLLSKFGRKQIRRVAAGTSASMKKINRKGLASIVVPLISLPEQEKIIATITNYSDAEKNLQLKLNSTIKLKRALLRYFLGDK